MISAKYSRSDRIILIMLRCVTLPANSKFELSCSYMVPISSVGSESGLGPLKRIPELVHMQTTASSLDAKVPGEGNPHPDAERQAGAQAGTATPTSSRLEIGRPRADRRPKR
jgi:hypothetical protein